MSITFVPFLASATQQSVFEGDWAVTCLPLLPPWPSHVAMAMAMCLVWAAAHWSGSEHRGLPALLALLGNPEGGAPSRVRVSLLGLWWEGESLVCLAACQCGSSQTGEAAFMFLSEPLK